MVVVSYFSTYIALNVNNRKALYYHDQDVLNVVLKGKIKNVNPSWNAQTSSYPGCEEQNEIGKNATIIHFISDRKPWLKGNNNSYEDEYNNYLKTSNWSDGNRYVGEVITKKQQSVVQRTFSKVTRKSFGNRYLLFVKILIKMDLYLGNDADLNVFFDYYYPLGEELACFTLSIIMQFAESGNPHAMVRVARAYKDGHGVERDMRESFGWFRRALDSGADWVNTISDWYEVSSHQTGL